MTLSHTFQRRSVCSLFQDPPKQMMILMKGNIKKNKHLGRLSVLLIVRKCRLVRGREPVGAQITLMSAKNDKYIDIYGGSERPI